MDAETRHQLKQNELGEALKRLSALNDPWVGYALVAVILVMAGYFGWNYWQQQQRAELASAWQTVILADPSPVGASDGANQLRSVISSGPNENVQAAAQLRLGVARRSAGRAGDEAALREALELFNGIANDTAAGATFRAAAMYAAAMTHEDLHQIDQARALYEQLRDQQAFAGSPYHDFAAERVAALEDLGDPVEFVPGLPPVDLDAIIPGSQPASQPAPAEPSEPVGLDELITPQDPPPGEPETTTAEDPAAEQPEADEPPAGEEPAPAASEPTEP